MPLYYYNYCSTSTGLQVHPQCNTNNASLLHARNYASVLTITNATWNTHTHTHTRLTALCPGLTGWAGTRKIKPIWILEKQESEWQWHQLGHMQVCTSLQTNNHTSSPPLRFLQARCPSCRPTNSVKALRNDTQFPDTRLKLRCIIANCTSLQTEGLKRSYFIFGIFNSFGWNARAQRCRPWRVTWSNCPGIREKDWTDRRTDTHVQQIDASPPWTVKLLLISRHHLRTSSS